MSGKALGRKYGISSSNISRHARVEGWPAARKAYTEEFLAQCAKLAAEKSAEDFGAYVEEMQEDLIRLNRILKAKMYETLTFDEPFSPRDLNCFSKVLSNMQADLDSRIAAQRDPNSGELTVTFINGEWEKEGS